MKTFILAMTTMVALGCFACGNQNPEGWTLDGKLEDVKEGWAYLTELKDGDWNVLDSVQLQDGAFRFSIPQVNEVKQCYLQFKDANFTGIYVKQILPVFCEKGTVQWMGNISGNDFRMSGTPNNDAQDDYNRVFHTISSSLYNLLYVDKSWQADTVHGPYVAQGKYMMLAELMPKFRYIYAEKYKDLDFSLAIYHEICMMDQNLKAAKVDSLLAGVPESLHNSPIYRELKQQADKLRLTGVGGTAPDFTLPTADGKTVSLASFRGKPLLLVFWASWCAPCRAEIPHLKKIYEKYHAQGLELLSVSVDSQKAAWEKALAETGMPWTQASDLKGLKSEVAKLYGIQGVPALWLLDSDGKILAVNLRGEQLDAKLQEVFQ